MSSARFTSAVPVLPALDILAAVTFYEKKLAFQRGGIYPDYAVLRRDGLEVHLWKCDDPELPKNTSCRINVAGIDALYVECRAKGIVHPNGPLETKPWGLREFAVLDRDGNLIKFSERPGVG